MTQNILINSECTTECILIFNESKLIARSVYMSALAQGVMVGHIAIDKLEVAALNVIHTKRRRRRSAVAPISSTLLPP